MKIRIAMVMMLALMTASGCRSTQDSSKGGVVPINEEFSITVPKTNSVKQGANTLISVTLNRGDYFKRDVQLAIKTEGLSITPNYVLIKASDKPEVKLQISAARDAAIGNYQVTVTGTPESGKAASTMFTVTVVAQ